MHICCFVTRYCVFDDEALQSHTIPKIYPHSVLLYIYKSKYMYKDLWIETQTETLPAISRKRVGLQGFASKSLI